MYEILWKFKIFPQGINIGIRKESLKFLVGTIFSDFCDSPGNILKYCIHLSRSLFVYFNDLVSVTAGGPESPEGPCS